MAIKREANDYVRARRRRRIRRPEERSEELMVGQIVPSSNPAPPPAPRPPEERSEELMIGQVAPSSNPPLSNTVQNQSDDTGLPDVEDDNLNWGDSLVDGAMIAMQGDCEKSAVMILGRELDTLDDYWRSRFANDPCGALAEYTSGSSSSGISYTGSGGWMGWSEDEINQVLGNDDDIWRGWTRSEIEAALVRDSPRRLSPSNTRTRQGNDGKNDLDLLDKTRPYWETYPRLPDGTNVQSYVQLCKIFETADATEAARIVGFPCFEYDAALHIPFSDTVWGLTPGDRSNVIGQFSNIFVNISRLATTIEQLGLNVVGHSIAQYLDADGNNQFLNPNWLKNSELFTTNIVQNQIVNSFNNPDGSVIPTYEIFSGLTIDESQSMIQEFSQSPQQINVNPWNIGIRLDDIANLHYSIASSSVSSTDHIANLNFEMMRNSNDEPTLQMTITQNIELYDRYDWRGEPIYFNPQTGQVRININDIEHIGPGYQYSTEINPVTNHMEIIDNDPSNWESDGFIRIPIPPDRARLPSIGTPPVGEVIQPEPPIFGVPDDHPNPLQLTNFLGPAFPALNFLPGGQTPIPSGMFHLLEDANGARPYYIFSNMDYTVMYEIPYSVDVNGRIVFTGEPNLVGSSYTSEYATETDNYVFKEIGDEIDYNPNYFDSDLNYDAPH